MSIRRNRFPFLSGLLSASIVSAGLFAVPGIVSADPDASETDGDARVELVEERTETETVFSNGDGTLTREISSDPIRVMTDKGWSKVDTNLEFGEDGTVRPKAAPNDMRMSGGGSGDLFAIESDGTQLAVGWDGELPQPLLDGNVATYAEVLPGVDLRVTVNPAGLSQVLVVKTAQAASNPKLRRLTLPIRADGGQVRETASGGLEAVDELGRQVLTGAEPVMWDSSGTVVGADRAPVSDASSTAIEARTEGPVSGDALDVVGADIVKDKLILTPPLDGLAGEGVAYPVFVDPVVTGPQIGRSMVYKEYPTTEFYNWSNGASGEGVGFQNADGRSTKRLFYRFEVDRASGGKVTSAEMQTELVHSWSCTAKPVEVWKTTAINANTNWNNQPDFAIHQDTISTAGGRAGCSPDGKNVSFDVTAGVARALNLGDTTATFGMKVPSSLENGSDPSGWKRFMGSVKLSITYSRPPTAPVSVKMLRPDVSCGATIGADAPFLAATLNDPDGENIRGAFEFYRGTAISGTPAWAPVTGYQKSGTQFQTAVEAPVSKDGHGDPVTGSYIWRVRPQDPAGQYGPWSGGCRLTIDATKPATPTISMPSEDGWTFGGAAREVTVGCNGSNDVVKFGWSVGSDEPTGIPVAVNTSGSAVLSVKPSRGGLNVLRVWSYDSSGNRSTVPKVEEFEAVGMATNSRFTLDEGAGSTAKDSLGSSLLTLSPEVGWKFFGTFTDPFSTAPPVQDHGLLLEGAGSASATTGTTLNTADSYTVSAFVDTTDVSRPQYAVSQSGASQGTFRLGVETNCQPSPQVVLPACWVMSVYDTATSSWTTAYSQAAATTTPGKTHLIGAFKAATGEVLLWVDGTGTKAVDRVQTPAASSPGLTIGASRTGATQGSSWWGWIDHIVLGTGTPDDNTRSQLKAEKAFEYDSPALNN